MKPTLVVLAAGMGSRYGGLKQIDPVGPSGEAILDYSVFDAHRAGFGKVVFIIRRDIEQVFREQVGSKFEGLLPVDYAFQDIADLPPPYAVPAGRAKPWGTAHAIRAATWCMNPSPPSTPTISTAATPSPSSRSSFRARTRRSASLPCIPSPWSGIGWT